MSAPSGAAREDRKTLSSNRSLGVRISLLPPYAAVFFLRLNRRVRYRYSNRPHSRQSR